MNAVAVPVLDRAGKLVAILGVQGPSARFRGEAIQAAARLLAARAADISAVL